MQKQDRMLLLCSILMCLLFCMHIYQNHVKTRKVTGCGNDNVARLCLYIYTLQKKNKYNVNAYK